LLAERHDEMQRCDRMMLDKMMNMGKKAQREASIRSRSLPSLRPPPPVPGGPAQAREFERIMASNAFLLQRLQGMKGELNMKKFEDQYEKSTAYLKIACEYKTLPLLKKKVRPGNKAALTRLPDERPINPILDEAIDYEAEDLRHEPRELRYVFREDREVDGVLFFVEMATDGSSLAISIYNAEADDGLELLVGEQEHRSILEEAGNDYSEVAARLHIEDGQLVVLRSYSDEGSSTFVGRGEVGPELEAQQLQHQQVPLCAEQGELGLLPNGEEPQQQEASSSSSAPLAPLGDSGEGGHCQPSPPAPGGGPGDVELLPSAVQGSESRHMEDLGATQKEGPEGLNSTNGGFSNNSNSNKHNSTGNNLYSNTFGRDSVDRQPLGSSGDIDLGLDADDLCMAQALAQDSIDDVGSNIMQIEVSSRGSASSN